MSITYTETERRPVEEWLARSIYNAKVSLQEANWRRDKATAEVEKASDEITELEQRIADFRVAQEELGFSE